MASTLCSCKQKIALPNQRVYLEFGVPASVDHKKLKESQDDFENLTAIGKCRRGQKISNYHDLSGEVVLLRQNGDTAMVYNRKNTIMGNEKEYKRFYITESGVNYCCVEIDGSLYEAEGGYHYLDIGVQKEYKLHNGRRYLENVYKRTSDGTSEISYYANGQIKQRIEREKDKQPKYDILGDIYYEYTITLEEYFTEYGVSLNELEAYFHFAEQYPTLKVWGKNLYLVLHPDNEDIYHGKAVVISLSNSEITVRYYWKYAISNSLDLHLYDGSTARRYKYFEDDINDSFCSVDNIESDGIFVRVGNDTYEFSSCDYKLSKNVIKYLTRNGYL